MQEFIELQSQTVTQYTYLCELHFIKQVNVGVKSQVPYIGYTFGHAFVYMVDPGWLEMDQKWYVNYKSMFMSK